MHGAWLLTVLLILGAVLRLAAWVAFGPSEPAFATAAALVAGLATGGLLHTLLVRWGVWRWLAAVAVLPVLLDVRVSMLEIARAPSAWVVLLVSAGVLCGFWRSASRGRSFVVAAACLFGAGVAGALAGGGSGSAGHRVGVADPGWAAALLRSADVGRALDPILVLGAALGLAACLGAGRSRMSGMRSVCGVLALLPAAVALGSSPRHPFSALDVAPVLAWWSAAGALGVTALVRGRRGRGILLPQTDHVDEEARLDFDRRYGSPRLAPVVVVIAAYNEGGGLPGVLASMPNTVCDLTVDVLVVDDGSSDATLAAVQRDPRAYAVRCARNRGQGAALRLGYRVAREHGAAYLLTTDADGQYDPADFDRVLAPVVEGRADFVTGSRRLGRQQTFDRVRRLGVHVFAWVVSALVGRRLTDTSFGLRAMHAQVTEAVTLNQPQYQSSELLIGAFSHGFTVLEVPGTMHLRTAGSTKKGRNLVYGRRYAGVVLGTWWREGCPRPVSETAPALRGSRGTSAG